MLTNNKNHPKIWTVISIFFAKSLVNINFYFIFAAMKKEFGKWLLDIAKYMVTALLLSTIFADMREPIIMYLVAIFSLVLLIIGLAVIYNSEQQEKVKQQKGKK